MSTHLSFDLEQHLLDTWTTGNDIELLAENIMERGMTNDEIVNVLIGLASLHNMKCQRAFDTFEALHKEICKMPACCNS